MGEKADEKCPFDFNFDPATFKVGDLVSYRVAGELGDFPFIGTITAVHEDHIMLAPDPQDPKTLYRATRESRPVVAASEIR
jgi:hypothetical protein